MKVRQHTWKPGCKGQKKMDALLQSHHKTQRDQTVDMWICKCEVLYIYIHICLQRFQTMISEITGQVYQEDPSATLLLQGLKEDIKWLVWWESVCAALIIQSSNKGDEQARDSIPLMSSPGWGTSSVRDKQAAMWGELAGSNWTIDHSL